MFMEKNVFKFLKKVSAATSIKNSTYFSMSSGLNGWITQFYYVSRKKCNKKLIDMKKEVMEAHLICDFHPFHKVGVIIMIR